MIENISLIGLPEDITGTPTTEVAVAEKTQSKDATLEVAGLLAVGAVLTVVAYKAVQSHTPWLQDR